MRGEVGATWDLAERASDVLLAHVWRTIVSSFTRALDRDAFLECFTRATSIAMPSQTVADWAKQAGAPQASTTSETSIDASSLRKIAEALLAASSPPSLLPLFPDATPPIRRALGELGLCRRTVAKGDDQRRTTATIEKLASSEKLHNLFVGPPGSGRTHALWHAACKLMERGGIIPIFVPLNGSMIWNDVLQAIADVSDGVDAVLVLRDTRVCVCFDGWSEFGSVQTGNERMSAMRVLGNTRVVANARRATDSDTAFDVWTLDPVPASVVRQIARTALPSALPPTTALTELLRLPLALSLFVLLDGTATSLGELLAHLHGHLSRAIPERFRDLLAGAVAAMTLAASRSYSQLLSEIRIRRDPSIQEPLRLLDRLGTIEDRAGIALPIHDLYWSWLSGLGLLAEDRIPDALIQLSTRESLQLALESGARPIDSMVEAATEQDIVLASRLNCSLTPRTSQPNTFTQALDEMLLADHLPIRCRAAAAALHSRQAHYVLPALRVLTQATEAGLYVPQLVEAISADNLFDNRGIVLEWLGSPGTEILLDAIADGGGAEWGAWLEQVARSGRVAPTLALAAALACDARIPEWAVDCLGDLVRELPWKLGAAAKRP